MHRSPVVLGKVLAQLPALCRLNLSGCPSLQGLPENVGDCASLSATLTELDLRDTSSMLHLPDSICDLASLTHLCTYMPSREDPKPLFGPCSEGRASRARSPTLLILALRETSLLRVSPCTAADLGSSLQSLPERLGDLSSLTRLHALNLYTLPHVPPSTARLTKLVELQLAGWRCARPLGAPTSHRSAVP